MRMRIPSGNRHARERTRAIALTCASTRCWRNAQAACGGQLAVCQLLIRHGANVNAQNEQGRSPLWRAAFMDRRECVELLLKHGADPMLHSVTLDTPACVAPSADLKAMIAEFPRERTLQLQAERAAYLEAHQWKPPEEDTDDAPCGTPAR